MANVEHSTLTGSNLHEPKGVAAATSGSAYIANGSGSGVWTVLNGVYTPTANQKNLNLVHVYHKLTDVSTAHSEWIVPGIAGVITSIKTVLFGTIATANAALTFEIGGTLVTNGGITIAFSGSAAGDYDSSTPTAARTITAVQPIEIITNGASSNAVDVGITFTIDVS